MNIWKPDYYEDFSCSASDCRYTCCQEWAIAVDDRTGEKWKTLKIPEEAPAVSGFSGKTHLSDLVKKSGDGHIIDLGKDVFCPLLNDRKLCSAVLAYGEESLSFTCHTFPRKCQRYENHLEFSLDLGCPEALDLLWSRTEFSLEKQEMENLSGSMEELAQAAEEAGAEDSLLFLIRDHAMNLMAREDIPLFAAWIMLFGLMLDFHEKGDHLTPEYVDAMFSDSMIERLKETVLKAPRDLIDHFTERNELFLDIAENYSRKHLYESVLRELTDRAEWFQLTDDGYVTETCEVFEDIWQDLEPKMRLLMQEEIYSGMLLPGGSLYSMLLKTEWLGLLLTVIKHGIFLRWELDECLTLEQVKDIQVVLLRMTGYSEADIEEYLEESFEDPVWPWGYMSLIL